MNCIHKLKTKVVLETRLVSMKAGKVLWKYEVINKGEVPIEDLSLEGV